MKLPLSKVLRLGKFLIPPNNTNDAILIFQVEVEA